jgi:hypothetical protein
MIFPPFPYDPIDSRSLFYIQASQPDCLFLILSDSADIYELGAPGALSTPDDT